jgi:hypothetical protein
MGGPDKENVEPRSEAERILQGEPPRTKWAFRDLLADPEYGPIVKALLPVLAPLPGLPWQEGKIAIENLERQKYGRVYLMLLSLMNDEDRHILARDPVRLACEKALDEVRRIENGRMLAVKLFLTALALLQEASKE